MNPWNQTKDDFDQLEEQKTSILKENPLMGSEAAEKLKMAEIPHEVLGKQKQSNNIRGNNTNQ